MKHVQACLCAGNSGGFRGGKGGANAALAASSVFFALADSICDLRMVFQAALFCGM